MTIIISLIVFCLIIIIHELGHFSAAKLFKMKVYEFSLGMGPVLLKRKKKETVYSLKLLPIGGSVQLGEDEEIDDPDAFRNKPIWQRMIVILAGAIMNIVLGFIICVIMVSMSEHIVTTTIGGFREGAVTSERLQAGDEILAINGMSVWTTSDISYQLLNSASKLEAEDTAVYDFVVRRGGERVKLDGVVFGATDNGSGGKSIIFDFYVLTAEKTFGNVIAEGFKQTGTMARLILVSLMDIVKGTYGLNDFAGPVGVVNEIGKVASMGFDQLLNIVAFITINVGIFNLLPIPALDGARFLFFIVEAIRRKPIKPEYEGMVHFVGFAALMVFMLVVTFNDIRRLVMGG